MDGAEEWTFTQANEESVCGELTEVRSPECKHGEQTPGERAQREDDVRRDPGDEQRGRYHRARIGGQLPAPFVVAPAFGNPHCIAHREDRSELHVLISVKLEIWDPSVFVSFNRRKFLTLFHSTDVSV